MTCFYVAGKDDDFTSYGWCMHIGINASFLRKRGTGIGQVTVHTLNEMIARVREDVRLRNHKFFLYCEEVPEGLVLPRNFTVRAFLPWYTRDDLVRKVVWEKHLLPRQARRDRCEVFVSLYQSATRIPYTDMRHVMVVHDVIPQVFPEYLNNMRKSMYWRQVRKGIYGAQELVAVSAYTKRDICERLNVPDSRITVAPIAVDPLFTHAPDANDSARVLKKFHLQPGYIYTSGLEVRKSSDRTLRAYRALRERYAATGRAVPDLVVSGKLLPHLAPLVVDVKKLSHELGVAPYVHTVDFVPQEDLPALYANAVMFVFPSAYEGFGMPVLEAMHSGTPVITCDDTSIGEVGGDAVVYVPHDDAALTAAMAHLLDDAAARERLVALGRRRAEQFTWRSFADHLWRSIGIDIDDSPPYGTAS